MLDLWPKLHPPWQGHVCHGPWQRRAAEQHFQRAPWADCADDRDLWCNVAPSDARVSPSHSFDLFIKGSTLAFNNHQHSNSNTFIKSSYFAIPFVRERPK